ncbi:transient receptor potential cation channel subfamily A member 1-like [Haliotis cracherodii]|uniref:transient receptor potential cation channel subfamily A member 1-like n=1 Tax=Haliotis cracherodii TaxID=6455 RepID=UPI0039E840B8
MAATQNKALLRYFSKLGGSRDPELLPDVSDIDELISAGADINCRDKYGQTILHEIARQWDVDVAKYLLKLGAAVDMADKYGRTPLHVAAASDYPQMIKLLIDSGADKEARSKEQLQTPVHFAARNDACKSLVMLIKLGCQYDDVKDYKGRTPLQLAAELDRSHAARYLLEKKASAAVKDHDEQKTITWMIAKMPQVAHEALAQFRQIDSQNRKQHHLLQQLVPGKNRNTHSHSPLQVAVLYHQFHVVSHPCMTRLLKMMWDRFGLFGACLNLLLNLVYILLWTVQGVLIEYDQRHIYTLPQDWWRIALFVVAVGFTGWLVVEEIQEFYRSRKANKEWVAWRTQQIKKDMKFCHPRWPEEAEFLNRELQDLNSLQLKYFQDKWNYFDWVCYLLLGVCVVTHLVDVVQHSELLARWHIRIMCVTIILLWLRLMKCVRAFTVVGPFIVMLGHMMTDLLRFLFLFLEFYIPYVCAFWMIYGGDKVEENGEELVEVDGFKHPGEVFFSLFQLTLVDEYDLEHMLQVDSLMTYLLLSTWFFFSAILCLNLFIALLTNTFQIVYDNAKANALMQKAITVLHIWEAMSERRQNKFLQHIAQKCSPLIEYYDDDVTGKNDDLKKVTMHIKGQMDFLQERWKERFGDSETMDMEQDQSLQVNSQVLSNMVFHREIYRLQLTLQDIQHKQQAMIASHNHDMKTILGQLERLVHRNRPAPGDGTDGNDGTEADTGHTSPQNGEDSNAPRKKKKKKRNHKSIGILSHEVEEEPHVLDRGSVPGLTRSGTFSKLRKRVSVNLNTNLLDVTD